MIKLLKSILRPFKPVLYPWYHNFYLKKKSSSFSEGDLLENLLLSPFMKGTMIDVGAHWGESFEFFEKYNWKVFAFEPDPENRTKIKVNSTKTQLFNFAVSDKSGLELEFYKSDQSSGISGLIPFHETHKSSFKVMTITMDDFLKQERIQSVHFLKIDTEGNDLLVLKGFPFERIQPEVVLCEFEDFKTQHLGYNFNDMGNYLLDRGYHVFLSEWYPIVEYGVTHQWRSIRPYSRETKLEDSNGWGNFIAIRDNRIVKFKKIISEFV